MRHSLFLCFLGNPEIDRMIPSPYAWSWHAKNVNTLGKKWGMTLINHKQNWILKSIFNTFIETNTSILQVIFQTTIKTFQTRVQTYSKWYFEPVWTITSSCYQHHNRIITQNLIILKLSLKMVISWTIIKSTQTRVQTHYN